MRRIVALVVLMGLGPTSAVAADWVRIDTDPVAAWTQVFGAGDLVPAIRRYAGRARGCSIAPGHRGARPHPAGLSGILPVL